MVRPQRGRPNKVLAHSRDHVDCAVKHRTGTHRFLLVRQSFRLSSPSKSFGYVNGDEDDRARERSVKREEQKK